MDNSLSLNALREAFTGRFLTDPSDMAPFLTDWRRRWIGRARCVAQPDTTEGVAAIVSWCAARKIPVVPQGGNTGLSGGAVPDESGQSVVLSLARLNRIRSVDGHNSSLIAEAGCILRDVQEAAAVAGKLFPLSLAAEGSCTIGGNLATNAGGTAVLRYGNARDLCLGLEVVTPGGLVWDGLQCLRKNNTGYDLRDLFIGAEGTLGVITAAVLRLHARPKGRAIAFVAVNTVQHAVHLLDLARDTLDSRLTAFELISHTCLNLVLKHHSNHRSPLECSYPWYVLIEVSDPTSYQNAESGLSELLALAFDRDITADGVVAGSIAQADALWSLRENVSESQSREGPAIKHDISMPISRLESFVETTSMAIEARWPNIRLVVFGHAGDGNLHFNLSPRNGADHASFLAAESEINRLVHDAVHAASGSISAEHGLGILRRDEAARYKSTIELELMRTIKHAIDPNGLMNPGKLLST